MYSPKLHYSLHDETANSAINGSDMYSSNMNSEYRKSSNDYYHNKENDFQSKRNDTESILSIPRAEKYSTSYVSKSHDSRGERSNDFNSISSPTHVCKSSYYLKGWESVKVALLIAAPAHTHGIFW